MSTVDTERSRVRTWQRLVASLVLVGAVLGAGVPHVAAQIAPPIPAPPAPPVAPPGPAPAVPIDPTAPQVDDGLGSWIWCKMLGGLITDPSCSEAPPSPELPSVDPLLPFGPRLEPGLNGGDETLAALGWLKMANSGDIPTTAEALPDSVGAFPTLVVGAYLPSDNQWYPATSFITPDGNVGQVHFRRNGSNSQARFCYGQSYGAGCEISSTISVGGTGPMLNLVAVAFSQNAAQCRLVVTMKAAGFRPETGTYAEDSAQSRGSFSAGWHSTFSTCNSAHMLSPLFRGFAKGIDLGGQFIQMTSIWRTVPNGIGQLVAAAAAALAESAGPPPAPVEVPYEPPEPEVEPQPEPVPEPAVPVPGTLWPEPHPEVPPPSTVPPPGVDDPLTDLDTLADRILGGLSALGDLIWSGFTWLIDSLWSMVEWLVERLWEMIEWLVVMIGAWFRWLWDRLWPALQWMVQQIAAWLRVIRDVLIQGFQALAALLRLILDAILLGLGNLAAVVVAQVQAIITTIGNWLSWLGDLLNGLATWLVTQLWTIAEWMVTALGTITVNVALALELVVDVLLDVAVSLFVPTYTWTEVLPEPPEPPPDPLPPGIPESWGAMCGPSFAIPVVELTLRTPNPPDSGCPGHGPGGARTQADDLQGSVWGYRNALRALLAFSLWLSVGFVGLRAMPWSRSRDDASDTFVAAGGGL